MRLTEHERNAIVNAIRQVDSTAKPYLFGSRVDDAKRGGDIDLFLISDDTSLDAKFKFLSALEKTLGERKIDLIIERSFDSAFARSIETTAQAL